MKKVIRYKCSETGVVFDTADEAKEAAVRDLLNWDYATQVAENIAKDPCTFIKKLVEIFATPIFTDSMPGEDTATLQRLSKALNAPAPEDFKAVLDRAQNKGTWNKEKLQELSKAFGAPQSKPAYPWDGGPSEKTNSPEEWAALRRSAQSDHWVRGEWTTYVWPNLLKKVTSKN